jgi:hypothetical protein
VVVVVAVAVAAVAVAVVVSVSGGVQRQERAARAVARSGGDELYPG